MNHSMFTAVLLGAICVLFKAQGWMAQAQAEHGTCIHNLNVAVQAEKSH
uniref:Uncharacterized protein n=1 Tax=Anguilla anguilla TaxID=7936 RepID=A0A0E9SDS5_ANGAN